MDIFCVGSFMFIERAFCLYCKRIIVEENELIGQYHVECFKELEKSNPYGPSTIYRDKRINIEESKIIEEYDSNRRSEQIRIENFLLYHDRVVALDVYLAGKLPDLGKLSKFKHLKSLTIKDSYFFSSFKPIDVLPSLNNITDLKFLRFDSCKNHDSDDKINLSSLTKLKIIDFESCEITRIPDFIFNIPNLQIICINNCESLLNIPLRDYNLINLTSLKIKNCSIDYIKEEISNLKNLKSLSFSGNLITKFPSGVETLEKLIFLDLSNNFISDIPDEISILTNLIHLKFTKNPILNISPKILLLDQLKYVSIDKHSLNKNSKVILDKLITKGVEIN